MSLLTLFKLFMLVDIYLFLMTRLTCEPVWLKTAIVLLVYSLAVMPTNFLTAIIYNTLPTIRNVSLYSSIQEAINAAKNGDVILIPVGIYREKIVINKSVTLKGAGMHLTVIDGDGLGTIMTIKADEVSIEGLTIRNARETDGASGIYVYYVNSFVITLTSFENCDIAIKIDGSSNGKVFNCIIRNCNIGVRLWYVSSNNTFYGNEIVNNSVGIDLRAYSFNSTFSNNVIANNSVGIYISHSHNNFIERNTISKNNFYAVYLYGTLSQNNVIKLNNITENYFGIYIWLAENNFIYRNNFVNNTTNAYVIADSNPPINKWNGTYAEGGNYWSGYTGEDKFCGPYQNITGNDEIIDKPYIIAEKNIDHYPFKSIIRNYADHESNFSSKLVSLLIGFAIIIVVLTVLTIIVRIKVRYKSFDSPNKNNNNDKKNYDYCKY